MKPWWASAAANTALRSEEPRTRFARWTARWYPPARAVPEVRFQAADEPFPHHWRAFPPPWPSTDFPANPVVHDALAEAVARLPETWRSVVVARDVQAHDAAEVSAQLGLRPHQQRAILNQARARLREHLAGRLVPDGER